MAAVTGKFLADFSSFYDAVSQANTSLKGMETNAATVEKRMNAVTNSFSGTKIVQDATIATQAVNNIGGATKLTASEAARLNAQVTEAIAKYKALGQTAPKELTDMAEATAKVQKETAKLPGTFGTITSSLSSMAGVMGIAFSAQAVVGFIGNVVDSAGKIADLSAKLGIGTDAVQGFTAAAELSGGTIDDVGNAIFKMNDNLSTGSKTTQQSLAALHLKLNDLRQMKPEDAFLAITDALETIKDPMERSRLEMDLFGKSGGALGAAIDAGFRQASNAANKMSEDTIAALDKAGDAWTKLKNSIVISTGTALGATLDFFDKILNKFDEGVAKARAAAGLKPNQGFTPEGTRIPEPEKPAAPPFKLGPTGAERAAADAAADAAAKKLIADAQAAAKALQQLRDSMFGTDQIAKANQYVEALGGIENLTRMSDTAQKAMNTTLGLAIDAYTRMGQVAPQTMRDIYTATLPLPPIISGIGAGFPGAVNNIKEAGDQLVADMKRQSEAAQAAKASYEAQTQAMTEAWNAGKRPWDDITNGAKKSKDAVDQTTASTRQLSVAMVDLGRVNQSAWESMVAGHQLMDAYRAAGVATGTQTALGGYNFQQLRATGVMPTSGAVGNTLNVNVNSTDAKDIANSLVTEMRHSGIRF